MAGAFLTAGGKRWPLPISQLFTDPEVTLDQLADLFGDPGTTGDQYLGFRWDCVGLSIIKGS